MPELTPGEKQRLADNRLAFQAIIEPPIAFYKYIPRPSTPVFGSFHCATKIRKCKM